MVWDHDHIAGSQRRWGPQRYSTSVTEACVLIMSLNDYCQVIHITLTLSHLLFTVTKVTGLWLSWENAYLAIRKP